MRQCDWCGLITDDDKICSWCGHVSQEALAAPPKEPDSFWGNTKYWLVGTAVAAILTIILVMASPVVVAGGDTRDDLQDAGSETMVIRRANRVIDVADYPSPTSQINNRAVGSYVAPEEAIPDEDLQEPNLDQGFDAYGSVLLAGAQIGMQADEEGNQLIGGIVGIANDGAYAITDLRLTLNIDGVAYPLSLMEPVGRIEPGEEIAIPVMAMGAERYGMATVTIQATVEGPPGICTDTVYATPL